jgi:hypothetical protein
VAVAVLAQVLIYAVAETVSAGAMTRTVTVMLQKIIRTQCLIAVGRGTLHLDINFTDPVVAAI